jgi:hypothetical protein
MRSYRLPGASDEAALEAALQFEVSGAEPTGPYGSANNAGIGLAMVREVSLRTGGRFSVVSLGASGQSRADHGVTVRPAGARWEGTMVVLSFHPGQMGEFQELTRSITEDFDHGRAGGPGPRFEAGPLPAGAIRVPVVPDVNHFAQNKDAAIAMRDTVIVPTLERGGVVALDFTGVRITTQSFMHALLYLAVRRFGDEALRRVSFHATSEHVQAIVRFVIRKALSDRRASEFEGG